MTEAGGRRPEAERSAARLLSDLGEAASRLFRQELLLFQAELRQQLARTERGVIALAAGTLIVFSGWCALLTAAILGLCTLTAPWLAAAIVGLANLLVGAGLFYFARSRLGRRSFALRRTIRSLRADAALLKERLG